MTALLAGATGLIGREIARQWSGPDELVMLVRKPSPSPAPVPVPLRRSLTVDYTALPDLPAADVAYCCLGTTTAVAGSLAGLRAVDLDAVVAFARAARRAGVKRLAVVSALGAKATSGNGYSRIKGEMEAAVASLGFESLVVARPSLLAGDRGSLAQPARTGERLALALTRPIASLIPKAWRPIEAAVVARALTRAIAEARPGLWVLESGDLQTMG
jgi:uncharacterized protein YbjT (DUF2867 family)